MTTVITLLGMALFAAGFVFVMIFVMVVYKIYIGSTWKAIQANRYEPSVKGQPLLPLFRDDLPEPKDQKDRSI